MTQLRLHSESTTMDNPIKYFFLSNYAFETNTFSLRKNQYFVFIITINVLHEGRDQIC